MWLSQAPSVRRSRRSIPLTALAVGLALVPSCIAAPDAAVVALRDPYGLIDDVAAAGNGLRIYVLPLATYTCSTDGVITPDIPDDAEPGSIADAVVDITVTVDTATDTATGEARVPVGDWTVLVEGRGVDPVSMRSDFVIASGCTTVTMLSAGETRDVPVTLLPQTGMGLCNDGILSSDEQCEPASTPLCDATCRTIAQPLNNNTIAGTQGAPHLASRAGRRTVGTFDSLPDTVLRMLDADGLNITSPGALERDATIDTVLMSSGLPNLPNTQLGGQPAVAPDGRIAIPLIDYAMGEPNSDVRLILLTADRMVLAGGAIHVKTSRAMAQRRPSAAFAGSGELLVVFEDTAATTGISATHFAAGSTTPTAEAAAVGSSGGTAPVLAAHDTGFVMAFAAADDVFFQRFGASGTPTDATPVAVLETATGVQDQPAIAALGNGTFVVAWREGDLTAGDGAGTAIRARIFGADGMPDTAAFVVDSTTAGDQSAPAVGAADGRFFFAWQSSGDVRARIFDATGAALRNREPTPDTSDFLVASGTATTPSVAPAGAGMTAVWLVAYAAPTDGSGDVLFRRYPR